MSNLKMISVNGMYLHNTFQQDGLKWRLIGSTEIKSEVNTFRLNADQKLEHILTTTHDEFKSEKGEYQTVIRRTIKVWDEQGKIEAVKI